MKKINYRAVMMVISPIIASIYTIFAAWTYTSNAHPAKQCIWTVCSIIWWVCGLLWIRIYYADKKLTADLTALEKKIDETQRGLRELLKYRTYFCEYIGRELRGICEELQITPQDIADSLGFRAEEVESVMSGELNAMPDHIHKILMYLSVEQELLEKAANEYAQKQMEEEKHPS